MADSNGALEKKKFYKLYSTSLFSDSLLEI